MTTPDNHKKNDLIVGTALGSYVVESVLGRGGFSTVYRVQHRRDPDLHAAAKVLHRADLVHRLRAEGAALRSLAHPHVVRVLDTAVDHDPPYLLLELVEGPSLRGVLRAERHLSRSRACRVVFDVLGALQYAHDHGIVHGDVKPENVLLDGAGSVRLADFGLCLRAASSSEAGCLLSGELGSSDDPHRPGTFAYAAPEVLAGEPSDARSDVYSAGILLFELLTGERPGPGDSLTASAWATPAGLETIFRRCCCRRRDRYPGAAAARDDLERFVDRDRASTSPALDPASTAALPEALAPLVELAQARVDAAKREAETRWRETLHRATERK